MLTPGAGQPDIGQSFNRGIFLRLATDPVVRVWSGAAPIRIAANDLDEEPQIYDGLGLLRNIPELDRLLNGEARRVSISLSGIGGHVAALLDADMATLDNARARIGHMRYDAHWRPTDSIRWVWDGLLDEASLEATQDGEAHEWTFTLSMSTALVDRNRPPLKFWTPNERPAPPPGEDRDKAFDYVPTYYAGSTRPYPPH